WGVGDDERALGRREVAVGDVDRDALLALRAQAVGEQRQVDVIGARVAAGGLDGGELVLEDRLGLVQQPADQGGLTVVDRAGGGEAEELRRLEGRWPGRDRHPEPSEESRLPRWTRTLVEAEPAEVPRRSAPRNGRCVTLE